MPIIERNGDVVIADTAGSEVFSFHGDGSITFRQTATKMRINPITHLFETFISGDTSWRRQSSRKVFNPVDYGAKGDGVHDDTSFIQQAVNDARKAGGGVVYLPAGFYKVTGRIQWYSNINLLGDGVGNTVLVAYGINFAVIQADQSIPGGPSPSSQIKNCYFSDFEIDGSNMGDGTYRTVQKGMYMQFCLNCRFERIYIHDTPATGFGNDYLQNCTYACCWSYNNGREWTLGQPGGAGFGIGTGCYQTEATLMIGCESYNSGRYGIFFERETNTPDGINGLLSQGVRVIGCIANGNGQAGICDKGCDGMLVQECTMASNTNYGYATTDAPVNSMCINNIIRDNGSYGIFLNDTGAGGHRIAENKVYNNGKHGVYVDVASPHVWANVQILDNEVWFNQNNGISITSSSSSSGYTNLRVERNTIYNNGQSGAYPNGIQLQAQYNVNPRIKDNKCYDDQATKTQTYGIAFGSTSNITGGVIVNNDVQNNKTGPMTIAGTFDATTVLDDNRGYNTMTNATAVTGWTSGTTFTYTAGHSKEILCGVGTGLGVQLNNSSGTVVLSGQTAFNYLLQPNQTVLIQNTTLTTLYIVK